MTIVLVLAVVADIGLRWRYRAADRPLRAVEHREEAVSLCVELAAQPQVVFGGSGLA
jgi:hypothetical protein